MRTRTVLKALLIIAISIMVTSLSAKEKFPETTKDGLKLKSQSRHGAVYVKQGASLADYNKIKLLDCYVAFEKNWQRNYNSDESGLDRRVSDKDVARIKEAVKEEFPKAFTKELEKGGYDVVDAAGKDVLLVRPAIINLTVTAPDIQSAGMSTTFIQSNGSMTLYMELYDSATSTKIAEVMDAEAVGDEGFAHQGGRVSNQMEFDRTVETWATTLRKRLDEAHGKSKK
jgi:hypothetical protein